MAPLLDLIQFSDAPDLTLNQYFTYAHDAGDVR